MDKFIESYYTERNETIRYDYRSSVNYGSKTQSYVDVEMILEVPKQTILYVPGFWQVLKNAWVKYFSSFVFFYFILNRFFLNYVITNGTFETV
jgi:hypothetical protein